ncbi:MAG: ArsA family ATPase [Deltaproteobacteria bacterium]|nr:ArsA family ATPase [Deltaproteobacteria bacterium]
MNLNGLDQKLHFLTGKGGVGKSTLAILLSLSAVKHKKKVLLVELDPQGMLSSFFNQTLNPTPRPLAPGLDGILITPRTALREYIVKQVKFSKIYDLIFENKAMHFFLDAAPGIDEIAVIGKIFYLDQQKKWDMIVVDTPASGHSLYLFKSPKVFLDITKVGPIAKRSEELYEMLLNPKRTAIHLVCLPEELPIQETLELNSEIKKLKLPLGKVFLNKMLPLLQNTAPETSLSILDLSLRSKIEESISKYQKRNLIQSSYQKVLEKGLGQKTILIPWILDQEINLCTLSSEIKK